jgi:hypothetical protein
MLKRIAVGAAVVGAVTVTVGIGIAQGVGGSGNGPQPAASVHMKPALKPGIPKTQAMFAVVNPDGTLARGSGVASSRHVSTGRYDVRFKRGVRKCGYAATIGGAGSSGTPAPGFVTVVGRNGAKTGIWVATTATDGTTATDYGFHLTVTCP